MTAKLTQTIESHFGEVDDPRYHHSPPHVLVDIITIALCAIISGANDWEAVAAFGRAKESWPRAFLRLPNGIPSTDTFERVFAQIDPKQFQASFISWVAAISHLNYSGAGAGRYAADGHPSQNQQQQPASFNHAQPGYVEILVSAAVPVLTSMPPAKSAQHDDDHESDLGSGDCYFCRRSGSDGALTGCFPARNGQPSDFLAESGFADVGIGCSAHRHYVA